MNYNLFSHLSSVSILPLLSPSLCVFVFALVLFYFVNYLIALVYELTICKQFSFRPFSKPNRDNDKKSKNSRIIIG